MPSAYQEFARKARERYLERQKRKATGTGQYQFTLHAQFKMKQYGLSEQRVRSVIRNPKRSEVGIMPKTVAVMQPTSVKTTAGKPVWKQEIWVMYQLRNSEAISNQIRNLKPQTPEAKKLHPVKSSQSEVSALSGQFHRVKIISAWRYPGVSPKRDPIPEEILRELEERSTMEIGDEI